MRTSRTCTMSRSGAAWQPVLRRIAALTGHPTEHMEDPQLACYAPGEFYRGHYDAPSPSDPDASMFLACGGPRLVTVLMYLNDVPRGGETHFEALRLRVRPERGRALLFFPAEPDGTLDARLWHEACTAADTKWVAQVWIRQRPDTTGMFMHTREAV